MHGAGGVDRKWFDAGRWESRRRRRFAPGGLILSRKTRVLTLPVRTLSKSGF